MPHRNQSPVKVRQSSRWGAEGFAAGLLVVAPARGDRGLEQRRLVRRGLFQSRLEAGQRTKLAQKSALRMAPLRPQRRKARHLVPQQSGIGIGKGQGLLVSLAIKDANTGKVQCIRHV